MRMKDEFNKKNNKFIEDLFVGVEKGKRET